MHAAESGSPACPELERLRRLAARLVDMVPGAATIHESLHHPEHNGPHPYALVKDAPGRVLHVSGTTGRIAARWTIRTRPDLDWGSPHVLDVADGRVTCMAGREH